MQSEKDYSNLTTEELMSQEKSLKAQKTSTALVIGALFGIAVYSATHKGFVLPVILMIVALGIGSRFATNLKSIQAEINRRNGLRP